MKEVLKRILLEQQTEAEKKFIERRFPEPLLSCKEIIIISGIRRCGKSVLLNQIRKRQTERDYYVNFDDERFINFSVNDFQLLHEVLMELYGVQNTFYFDEIQNIIGWERFVRRLYDSGCKIFITGSNAQLLSKELGTHLTGRYMLYELFPFSFEEFMLFHGITYTEKEFYTTEGRSKLSKACAEYFLNGGFPQYLENKNRDYLTSLYQSILYRDVMVRNKLINEREILELMYFLASNVSKLSSYNSLAATIGVSSSTTVKNYIEYIENTYMLFQVNKFDFSFKKQIQNSKKFYFIDNAIVNKLGYSFSENYGRLLENLVFVHLKRLGKEVFYYKNGSECDFLIRENNSITKAIQVSYSIISEETRKREMQGLIAAMNTYHLTEGIIITMSEEQEVNEESQKISILPAWKFLLDKF